MLVRMMSTSGSSTPRGCVYQMWTNSIFCSQSWGLSV